jgi:glyoxylase-like metal-dependent hydrolase (beta-lactamase superfamily II)
VTHYHDDRTAGLEFLRNEGVKTYSSKLTNDLSKTFNEKQAEFIFENDTTFNIGGYQFETLYAGEGHTKDNLVIWFEKHAVLYGGCLVKSVESKTLGNTDDANMEAWSTTIKKIAKEYPRAKFVIPGHFGGTGKEALRHTLKLLKASD